MRNPRHYFADETFLFRVIVEVGDNPPSSTYIELDRLAATTKLAAAQLAEEMNDLVDARQVAEIANRDLHSQLHRLRESITDMIGWERPEDCEEPEPADESARTCEHDVRMTATCPACGRLP